MVPRPHTYRDFQHLYTACVKWSTNIKYFKGVWLACIGGYGADLLSACMVLGRIQNQKQKYNLKWS